MFGAFLFLCFALSLSRGPLFVDFFFGPGIAELYLLPFMTSVYLWYSMFGLFILYLFFAIDDSDSYVSTFSLMVVSYFTWKHYNHLTLDSLKQFGTGLAIYFVCAIVWCVIKMRMHSKSQKYHNFVEAAFKKNEKVESLSIARNYFNMNYNIFINWFLYWPVSILNTLLADVFSDLIDALFEHFRQMFLNILSSAADNMLATRRHASTTTSDEQTRKTLLPS